MGVNVHVSSYKWLLRVATFYFFLKTSAFSMPSASNHFCLMLIYYVHCSRAYNGDHVIISCQIQLSNQGVQINS